MCIYNNRLYSLFAGDVIVVGEGAENDGEGWN